MLMCISSGVSESASYGSVEMYELVDCGKWW